MDRNRITEILEAIRNVRAGVYGDFALDAYLIMDPEGSEISVETGLKAEAVKKHYYSPGGASNIIANLSALKPSLIKAIGVTGDDIHGRELTSQLLSLNADLSDLHIQNENFDTITFTKKYLDGKEQPRIDFGVFNSRSDETDRKLLKSIESALRSLDVLIFNQQVPGSITNKWFIDKVNGLFEKYDDKIILLDTRHYGDQFARVYRKINDIELIELNGLNVNRNEPIPIEKVEKYGRILYERSGKPLFITRGQKGMVVIDDQGVFTVPGIDLNTRTDTVGAGDTTTSAIALCLGSGSTPVEAATLANYAAAVTVQKLLTTGTATDREILKLFDTVKKGS